LRDLKDILKGSDHSGEGMNAKTENQKKNDLEGAKKHGNEDNITLSVEEEVSGMVRGICGRGGSRALSTRSYWRELGEIEPLQAGVGDNMGGRVCTQP